MNQTLLDVVVLSVPALTVLQLPVNHPRRQEKKKPVKRNIAIHKLCNLDNDQNINKLQNVEIGKHQRMWTIKYLLNVGKVYNLIEN